MRLDDLIEALQELLADGQHPSEYEVHVQIGESLSAPVARVESDGAGGVVVIT